MLNGSCYIFSISQLVDLRFSFNLLMALDFTSMLWTHFSHSSAGDPSEGKYMKHFALMYSMIVGSSFSFPRPLTFDFNRVSSSNRWQDKIAAKFPLFLLFLKRDINISCGRSCPVATVTSGPTWARN